jgi:selenocysteine-specific elongation factor
VRAFVVGTAGHVDHGKTALVRALTGVETDRWREERERGLTIDLGFAPLALDGGLEASVVDVPGHEDFVKNMLAGATGIDLVLLVIAADEGPMPQTREHLSIVRLLGVEHGIVVLTKTDLVDADWLDLCRSAVREELEQVIGHAAWPIIPVSSSTGEGIQRLRTEIGKRAHTLRASDDTDLFRLPVDRSFSVAGAGTVVTGTVWSGTLHVGDEVRVLPCGRSARVRSLQVHAAAREAVGPRRRCALSLVGFEPREAPRGSVVLAGEEWRELRRLGIRLSVLAHSPRPVHRGQRVRIYLGTREVLGRVRLRAGAEGADAVGPGDEAWAVLDLEQGLVARVGDRFVVRFYSPVVTIGGGIVAELEPPIRWGERVEAWGRMLSGTAADRVQTAVALAGGKGIEGERLPLVTGLSPGRIRALCGSPELRVFAAGGRWFAREAEERARWELRETLARLHDSRPRAPGVSREAVRSQLASGFALELVGQVMEALLREGTIVAEGPEIRLDGHEARLTAPERRAHARLLAAIDSGGLEPPLVSELGSQLEVPDELLHDLLRLLSREGKVERVSPEIYLSARSAARLREAAERAFHGRSLALPTDFKRELAVTRKYLIPLLEHLDRMQVTRRTEDGRLWIA